MTFKVLRTPDELVAFRYTIPPGMRVGYVPLGRNPNDLDARALRTAKRTVDVTIVSVYTLEIAAAREDLEILQQAAIDMAEEHDADAVFAPRDRSEIYPGKYATRISIENEPNLDYPNHLNAETLIVKMLSGTRPDVIFLTAGNLFSGVYMRLIEDIWRNSSVQMVSHSVSAED